MKTASRKKRLKLLGGILILEVVWLLTLAASPSMNPNKFPSSGILHYDVSSAPATSDHLRVVTYNIGYASGDKNNQGAILSEDEVRKNLEQIISSLGKLNPDIVALQEVDIASHRTFDINELETLARGLHLPHVAYAVTWNKKYIAWPYWPPSGHFGRMLSGQAVLSRYPITAQDVIRFDKPADNAFWYNWFYIDRVAQQLTVAVNGKSVQLFNLHLEAFSARTKMLQIQKVSTLLPQNPDLIVLGDFNSSSHWSHPTLETPDEDSGEALKFFLEKTRLTNTNSELDTFPSTNPDRKIDHVLIGSGFTTEKTGVLGDLKASDHLPFWVDLK